MNSVSLLDFEKAGGLITAIAQDVDSGEILMVAHMNEDSFRRTLELGEVVYWSRSRQKLWHKGEESEGRNETTAAALRLKPKAGLSPSDYYPAFKDMVLSVLDGNMDSLAFEDTMREMFGIHAFKAFTLDKVIANCVRQLQHLVTDDSSVECWELYQTEKKNNGTGGEVSTADKRYFPELLYQKKSEKILADENCFKIVLVSGQAVVSCW